MFSLYKDNMELIKIFDKKDYDPNWQIIIRQAARAIIVHDGKLAMIKSEKYGDYKFIGGGIKEGESYVDALMREAQEEAGLFIVPSSLTSYGKTIEHRAGDHENVIFEQTSYYYSCNIDPSKSTVAKLEEGYEVEYGYKLEWVTPKKAIAANEKLLHNPKISWVERDLYILKEVSSCILT